MTKKFISNAVLEEILEKNSLNNLKATYVVVEARTVLVNIGSPDFINLRIAAGRPKKDKDLLITVYAQEIFTGTLLEQQESVINEADPDMFNKITHMLIKLEAQLLNKKLFKD